MQRDRALSQGRKQILVELTAGTCLPPFGNYSACVNELFILAK